MIPTRYKVVEPKDLPATAIKAADYSRQMNRCSQWAYVTFLKARRLGGIFPAHVVPFEILTCKVSTKELNYVIPNTFPDYGTQKMD